MNDGVRGQRDSIWFDDIVLATEYIGPLEDAGIKEDVTLPGSVVLEAYPNPFNSTITIRYSIPRRENISLLLYDVKGSESAIIEQGVKLAGRYSVVFDGENLSSGLYLLRFIGLKHIIVRKVLFIE